MMSLLQNNTVDREILSTILLWVPFTLNSKDYLKREDRTSIFYLAV